MSLFAVFTLSNTANIYASNFVCAQDLDGNGDVTGIGENASCQVIGTEQFCSVGAQICNVAATYNYKCSLDDSTYDDENSCKSSCMHQIKDIQTVEIIDFFNYDSSIFWFSATYTPEQIIFYPKSSSWSEYTKDGVEFKKGSFITRQDHPDSSTPFYALRYTGTATSLTAPVETGSCSKNNISNIYSCPTVGNSCVDVGGIQKCSINSCIDLDADNTITETSPDLDTPNADDGNRDVDGACTERALIFDGKGMRCRYKGWFGLADNCCKSSGQVLSDSTGSYATTMATKVAMSATWHVLKGAYASYHAQLTYNLGAGMSTTAAAANASTYAASGGQAAMSSFSIDPTTLAISLAIKVFMDMMGCEQSEQEAAIYKGSGYCHEVGSFCSKKIALLGCVEKSKSMCCFNSKLARILQEQGRVQLGKSWGAVENPSCGGFNPAEFQALDFSRIDMSEYYGDIQSKGQSLIQNNITDSVQDYYRQIKQ